MRGRIPRSRVTHERWLVSYADFITLLFAFFVVLYAFAKADQKKQQQVSVAIDTAFHSLALLPDSVQRSAEGTTFNSAGPDSYLIPKESEVSIDVLSPAKVKHDLDQMRRELEQSLSGQISQHSVSIQMDREGLVISLREAGFFSSGSAVPQPETLETLRKIAVSLSRTPYDVRVEGHTDNLPIHSVDFDSNWELSSARATRIARLFLEMRAIEPGRLSAAGYAEFHPIATNTTAAGRAENRRVDLVVMPRNRLNLSLPQRAQSPNGWRKITDN